MTRTLHVIGNGFDIANGVRSSYRDFREYLMGQGPDGVRLVESLESCLGGAPDLWGDFEESLASMDRGRAMDSVDAAMGRSPEGQIEDDRVRDSVDEGLADMLDIEASLPIQFFRWLCTLKAEGPVWQCPVPLDPEGRFISFNYTDILESRYGIPRDRIMYIHGSVARGSGSIVMGHGGDPERMLSDWMESVRGDPMYLPYVEEDGVSCRNTRLSAQAYGDYLVDDCEWGCDGRFKAMGIASRLIEEYFGVTAKRCDEVIARNSDYFESLHDVDRVVLIGHSLSTVDLPYFRRILECSDDPGAIRWEIGYHSRRARAEAFSERLGLDPSKVTYYCTM